MMTNIIVQIAYRIQKAPSGRLREDRELPVPDRFGICRTIFLAKIVLLSVRKITLSDHLPY